MRARYLLLIMVFAGFGATAQHAAHDTALKQTTIVVLPLYKPQVKQAPKPEWIPQLPPADTSHPTFTYDVPQQTLFYTYSSLPLRPLAMGHELPKLPFENYVKAGGGNLSTIFVDAGVGSVHGADYETDFHLHYLSQAGDIKYQQSSQAGIEAEWLQHFHKSDWHAVFNGERNQYYYYGYDHNLYPSYTADSLKQTFGTLRLAADMKNNDSKASFSYHPVIDASLYTAARNTSEVNIGARLPFEYKFDNTVQALLTVSADDAHLATKDTGRDNAVAAIAPGVRLTTDAFTAHAILGYAFGMGNNQYVLPDVQAAFTIPHTRFTITAGYESALRQNTFQQLSTENPYIFSSIVMRQTKSDELYGQLQYGIGDHLVLMGRVSSWNFSGLPEFLNDMPDHKQFYLVYDTVTAISFKTAARYKVSNKWSAGVSGDFYGFNTGKQPYVWHEPGTKIVGDITATFADKLVVSAYLALLSGVYAKDANHNAVLLDPVMDIGGNAEYQVVKRLSVFVQLSNLLNSNYQRWYGYQAYGFNVYGGLRLKF